MNLNLDLMLGADDAQPGNGPGPEPGPAAATLYTRETSLATANNTWALLFELELEANTTYVVDLLGTYQAGADFRGIQIRLNNVPAGADAATSITCGRGTNDTARTGSALGESAIALSGVGNAGSVLQNGFAIKTGGTAGTVRVEVAGNGDSVTVAAGCNMIVRTVADAYVVPSDLTSENATDWKSLLTFSGGAHTYRVFGPYNKPANNARIPKFRITGLGDNDHAVHNKIVAIGATGETNRNQVVMDAAESSVESAFNHGTGNFALHVTGICTGGDTALEFASSGAANVVLPAGVIIAAYPVHVGRLAAAAVADDDTAWGNVVSFGGGKTFSLAKGLVNRGATSTGALLRHSSGADETIFEGSSDATGTVFRKKVDDDDTYDFLGGVATTPHPMGWSALADGAVQFQAQPKASGGAITIGAGLCVAWEPVVDAE
jgi:hypothetical protein